uniref:Putative plasma membrane glycoprotein cd36 n=1 Tax=Lutzomyia longipalpis TaxID=7200 RepID=A0A7G3AVF2_LUTLO
MQMTDFFSKQCCLGTIGLILAGFGTLFAIFWVDILETQIINELKLAPDTRTYDMWKSPPLDLSIEIYLFNWTNHEDFLNASSKPIVKELGPYVFTEKPDKVDISWHPENATVSFGKLSVFHFDAEKSKGSLDDVITSVNIVALSAAEKVRWENYVEQKKVSLGLSLYNQEIHVTKTAREFLFDGYEDDLIEVAKQMSAFSSDIEVPFDRAGYFYMRNNSASLMGRYNMYTGADDISKIGKIGNWNYGQRTEFFEGHCGMINGSAGEFYPPYLKKDQVSFFSPDMCRTLPFDFEKESEVEGILGYKFTGGAKTIDNGTLFPENSCFCAGECMPSGVLNISSCRYGSPVFVSFPHFYAADPFYLDQVEGINPSREKHEFFLTIEPKMGIPLEVAARFQLNLLIRPSTNVALYQEVPTVFFPVLWFQQKVLINPEMAADLRQVLALPTIGYICAGVAIIFGVLLILWFPLLKLICGTARSQRERDVEREKRTPAGPDGSDSPLIFTNGVKAEIKTKPHDKGSCDKEPYN